MLLDVSQFKKKVNVLHKCTALNKELGYINLGNNPISLLLYVIHCQLPQYLPVFKTSKSNALTYYTKDLMIT